MVSTSNIAADRSHGPYKIPPLLIWWNELSDRKSIDNNVVTIITILHTLEDNISSIQNKPMVNQANKNLQELFWGT